MRRAAAVVFALLALAACDEPAAPRPAVVTLDDPVGDAQVVRPGTLPPMDVRRVRVAWGASALEVRIEFTTPPASWWSSDGASEREVGGVVWLDTDARTATGLRIGGIGADFQLDLGGALNAPAATLRNAEGTALVALARRHEGNAVVVAIPLSALADSRTVVFTPPGALGATLHFHGVAQAERTDDRFPDVGHATVGR